MKMGLKLKWSLIMVIIILVISTVTYLITISRVSEALKGELMERALTIARGLAYNSEYGIFTMDRVVLDKLIAGALREKDIVYCGIYDKDGVLISGAGAMKEVFSDRGNDFRTDRPQRIISGGEGYYAVAVPVISSTEGDWSGGGLFTGEDELFGGEEKEADAGDETIGSVRVVISKASARKNITAIRIAVAMATLLILVLGVSIAIILINRLIKPINRVSTAFAVAAETGDLGLRVKVKSGDEVGKLAESFGLMMDKFSDLVSNIQKATNRVGRSAGEILAASREQAAGARRQSASVGETSAASEELSRSAGRIGESIQSVSRSANQTMDTLNRMKESIEATSGKIGALGESSREISKIIDVINGVADQTNLLAVNAAIEAARAGSSGRAFSVVADEIRKLSDSTTDATENIARLIKSIQSDISQSIISMEESLKVVAESVNSSRETTTVTREIALAANQQLTGTRQIAEAMIEVDRVAKEMEGGSELTTATARELEVVVKEVEEQVARFKLSDRN